MTFFTRKSLLVEKIGLFLSALEKSLEMAFYKLARVMLVSQWNVRCKVSKHSRIRILRVTLNEWLSRTIFARPFGTEKVVDTPF